MRQYILFMFISDIFIYVIYLPLGKSVQAIFIEENTNVKTLVRNYFYVLRFIVAVLSRSERKEQMSRWDDFREDNFYGIGRSLFADYESALSSARTFRLFPAGDETFDRMRDGIILQCKRFIASGDLKQQ